MRLHKYNIETNLGDNVNMTPTLKEAVASLVSESFKKTLDQAVEDRMSIFEAAKKPIVEEEEEDDREEEEDDRDEDEDDDDDDDESEDLKEALKVEAKPVGSKNKAPVEEFEVKDMRELAKIVKTGKYGWLMVTKKNGDEDEYTVENGKLVLM